MILRRSIDGRPTAYGRLSRLALLALALGASYGAGYLSHDAAPAVAARLAAWSERPADAGRAAVPATLGPVKRGQLEGLLKTKGER